MRVAFQRFAAPLLAKIPDVSRVPLRRQVLIGAVASILLHIVALFVFALMAGIARNPDPVAKVKPLPALEVEILPPEPKILAAPVPPEKEFIDSRGLAESKPAEDAIFETDKDMTAASEQPATGDRPLPSQNGQGRIDKVFNNSRSMVGAVNEPPVMDLTAPPPRPPSPPVPPSPPSPPARETSAPPKPPQVAAATPAPPIATPPPKQEEKPERLLAKSTLERLREVEKKREEELALAAKEKLPPLPDPVTRVEKPIPEPPVLPAIPVRPTQEQLAKLTTPSPLIKPPSRTGYQPEQEKSRVEGRITNRGRNAVDAQSTPLGKYKSQVYNAIGARWLYHVKDRMDLLAIGSARVSFYITRSGKAQGIRIDANTANTSFADVCQQAIREAEISMPPPGVLDELRDGRLDYTITFTLYSLHE